MKILKDGDFTEINKTPIPMPTEEKPMRYFIVFYVKNSLLGEITGELQTTSETYPSRDSICLDMGVKEKDVAFTNIIELNLTDYNNWIK
jgi:hypothetical protein